MPPQRKTKPISPDHAALAAAIEAIIAERDGMSQQTLAEITGLSQRQINALVRGQSNPTFTTLLRVCKGLDVRLSELTALMDKLHDQGVR
jgi:DNA-binding phage protein